MFYVENRKLVRTLLRLGEDEFAVWNTDDEKQAAKWDKEFSKFHGVAVRKNAVTKKASVKEVSEEEDCDVIEETETDYEHGEDSTKGISSLDRLHHDSLCDDGIEFEEGTLHDFGEMKVYEKKSGDAFSRLKYYCNKYGTMKCKSSRDYVHFKKIKAQGIIIPQVKEMNCTLKPEMAKRNKVMVLSKENYWEDRELYSNYKNADNRAMKAMYARDIAKGSKISFDKWILIGSVNAIIYRMYRNFKVKGVTIKEKVPHCLYITYADLFRNMFPDITDFTHVTDKVFGEFVDWCMDTFEFFNTHGMIQELPYGKGLWIRKTRKYKHILKTSAVQEYDHLHDVWKESGVRIYMPDYEMFDRIMPKKRYIPILDYELDNRGCINKRFVFKTRMLNIYIKWFVQYLNYNITHENRMIKERNKRYITKKDIREAFRTGRFDDINPNVWDMCNIFKSMSVEYLGKYDETDFKKNKGIRPAKVLEYKLIGESRIEWTQTNSLKKEDIVFRDEKGNKRRFTPETLNQSREIDEARRKIEEINIENNKHRVRFNDNRVETHLQVIFKSVETLNPITKELMETIEPDKCGRQYTMSNGYQGLRAKERLRLTIDGEKVCEVDYSSLHPHMLYAMEGVNYTGDVYDTGNLYRSIGLSKSECRLAAKLMLLIAINSEHIHNGIYSFKEAWINHEADLLEEQGKHEEAEQHRKLFKLRGAYKIGWIWQLYRYLEAKHSTIKKYFGSGFGVKLQAMDGKIMRNVCYEFACKGHCSLPVHDSVVVKQRDREMAISLMIKYYEKMFPGFTCPVKVKV